jgi:hypothetical protein
MSYASQCSQRNLPNELYNITISIDPNKPQSIASIGYVNDEVAAINDDTTTITDALATEELQRADLEAQITALQTRVEILILKNEPIIGSIIMQTTITPPTNYLLCNGDILSTTTYAKLFAVLKYEYGGSGNTFAIPSMYDNFIVGGNGNTNGIAVSNLLTGNNYTGAYNNYDNYGDGYVSPNFPIIQYAPSHSHTITEPNGGKGHQHSVLELTGCAYGPNIADQRKYANPETAGVISNYAYTGITIKVSGQATDPISNIAGVNVTPPFIAQYFFIRYN